MSSAAAVRVLYSNTGILTLITLRVSASTSTSCLGAIMATLVVSSSMLARASAKFLLAAEMPASTRSRNALFSRTISKNWRMSSSRLSLSSLWPRMAVTSFFFKRVSSIRVGLTCVEAISSPFP